MWGHPIEGYGRYTCPTCPAHSYTAVLETQLSCCGYLKNLGTKNSPLFVLSAAPPAVQPFEWHSTHVASLSASRIAVCWAYTRNALSFTVNTRSSSGFPSCLYSREFCMSSTLTQFDLRFEYKCSPNAFGFPQLQKGERRCSQPISGHPEAVITFWVIFCFSEGLRTTRVNLDLLNAQERSFRQLQYAKILWSGQFCSIEFKCGGA